MKYITGYVWQSPHLFFGTQNLPRESSVLLQQVSYGKRNVLLACVCSGGVVGGYLTERLRTWMSDQGKELFSKKTEERFIKKELEKQLKRLYQEAEKYCEKKNLESAVKASMSGILAIDQACWLMQSGEDCLVLLNKRYQRTHCRYLFHTEGVFLVTEAEMERGVGILLGNSAFLQQLPKESIAQCLAPQDILKEEQIGRRLAELAEESRRLGYLQECSAVYIRSV